MPNNNTIEKTCTKCGITKPLSDFHASKIGRYGKKPNCKSCQSAAKKAYYSENRERLLAQNAEYRKTEAGREAQARYLRTRGGRATQARKKAKWAKKNPKKLRAHWAVRDAKKSGKLTPQPCEVCGKSRVDAHHDDYSKPLDVHWLCSKHHAETHNANTELVGQETSDETID